MQHLADALAQQRPVLKSLLAETGVPVAEAEELLIDALCEEPWEQWAEDQEIDRELVRVVRDACLRYGLARSRPDLDASGFLGRRRAGSQKRGTSKAFRLPGRLGQKRGKR